MTDPTFTSGDLSFAVNKLWECPKGHRIEQAHPFTVKAYANGGDLVPSQPVCQACYVEWIQATFPITEVS